MFVQMLGMATNSSVCYPVYKMLNEYISVQCKRIDKSYFTTISCTLLVNTKKNGLSKLHALCCGRCALKCLHYSTSPVGKRIDP